ncbi:carbonic anhydrase [Elusimicrobium posterum]|uniref:carbonic anhydrase family protein n=1 Tax=Elusimicrobium posterum TaxID=3116653 RepID=UPI003C756B9D
MLEKHALKNTILTAAEQAKLTPLDVLNILKEGNEEFVEDRLTVRNNTHRVRVAAMGQYPKAAVLSCFDSRVPVEDVFHRGIGDIFVARVAGNIINDDIVGSFELACNVSGAKLILVMGHEHCAAVRSAIDGMEMGHMTKLLAKISPSVEEAKKDFKGKKTLDNPKFVDLVSHKNVENSIKEIRRKSRILRELEDSGKIMIAGAMYYMKTGKVKFFKYDK